MLSCKEIADHASALVDDELTFSQKLPIYLHLLMCVHCRRFIRQFKLMLTGSRYIEEATLSEDEVETVVRKIHAARAQSKR